MFRRSEVSGQAMVALRREVLIVDQDEKAVEQRAESARAVVASSGVTDAPARTGFDNDEDDDGGGR